MFYFCRRMMKKYKNKLEKTADRSFQNNNDAMFAQAGDLLSPLGRLALPLKRHSIKPPNIHSNICVKNMKKQNRQGSLAGCTNERSAT